MRTDHEVLGLCQSSQLLVDPPCQSEAHVGGHLGIGQMCVRVCVCVSKRKDWRSLAISMQDNFSLQPSAATLSLCHVGRVSGCLGVPWNHGTCSFRAAFFPLVHSSCSSCTYPANSRVPLTLPYTTTPKLPC